MKVFFFQAEDGIRDRLVTGVQTCALPISWRISRRAPLIGEHNEEVLCGELGLSKAELAVLEEKGSV